MENQVLDAIFNRRSIRRYTDQPVSSDQLDLILKAGQAAPSAMNQQPWYFVAIQRKDMIEQLASLLTENEDPYYNAPLLIVVFANKKAYSPVTDAALAIANMMLAAQALQLGTCWIDYSRHVFNHQGCRLSASLGVPQDYLCVGSLVVGTPAEQPEAHPVKSETMTVVA
ncbi:MAG: nitroreductase family protein [Holdemania filiformis]